MKKQKNISRRNFLKSITSLGLGVAGFGTAKADAQAPEMALKKSASVPMRPFGKSNDTVSQLGLGCAFDTDSAHLLLNRALALGVNYWDTGTSYGYGKSEAGIGRFFKRFPKLRPKVFLCTKTEVRLPQGMTWALEDSLKRLQTAYVDFYCAHAVSSIDALEDMGLKQWVEQAKKDGLIRHFGISTHKNMQSCMLGAVRLGWIDGIMMSYNYRLMHLKSMQEAIEQCQKAGIALIAMKTQAQASESLVGKDQLHLEQTFRRFMDRGLTPYQARLKAVWANSAITSICSHMPNTAILNENAVAAANKAPLSRLENQCLAAHGRNTQTGYCAGCGHICESVAGHNVPISDVMRHLMYYHNYRDRQRMHRFMRELPDETLRRLVSLNYTDAEHRCPQKMAIGRFMKTAVAFLA